MNSSYFIIQQVLDINANISNAIRSIGEDLFRQNISFSNLITSINNNLNIQKWQITESDFPPRDFIDSQDENNNSNSINPQNTVSNNTIANNNVIPNQGYSNMTITVSLNANQKYFMWIKDVQGNVISQGFTIKKAN